MKKMDTQNEQIQKIKKTVGDVITNPAGFYKDMPVSGGLADPMVFLAAMGIVTGIIQAFLSIIGFGYKVTFFMAIASIIFVPLMAVIFSFIGAGIFFVIWKLMGSEQSFETAYRCVAYAAAISPITTLIGVIPYLGALVAMGWMLFLIVTASQEVHKLESQKTWIVFGIVFGLFALLNLNSQYAARNMKKEMKKYNKQMEQMENMTSEEAGRAMGEFFKGFNQGSEPE
jgi:hypothetical protein